MFIVIGLIFLALSVATHYYVGRRIFSWLKLRFPKIKKVIYWPIYFSFIGSFIVSNFISVYWIAKPLAVIGYYWLGLFAYLLMALLIVELIRLLSWIRIVPKAFVQSKKVKQRTGTIIAILIAITLIYGSVHTKNITVATYEVEIDKSVDDLSELNVVMMSDLHFGYMYDVKAAEKWVEKVNALNPDIVLIPGDIFDGDMHTFANQKETAAALRALDTTYGVFASLGNHDAGPHFDEMRAFCKDAGFILLEDEAMPIDDRFYVAGMKDASPIGAQGTTRQPIADVVREVDHKKPILLLDHQPNFLDEAKNAGVDLVVSGHTHRGQIFPGRFLTNQLNEANYGYYQKDTLHAIVTSGIATWGPPIRIGTDAEIVQIQIRFK